MAKPETPREAVGRNAEGAPEAGKLREGAETPTNRVGKAKDETREQAGKAIAAEKNEAATPPWKPEWERLPALHMSDVRSALKAIFCIAVPPLAVSALGGVAALKWAKGKLPGQEGPSIKEAVRSTMSPKEMGRGVLGVLKYPFQLGKSLTKNALVLGHRVLSPPIRLLKFIGKELYTDTREVIETLAGLQPKAEGQINVVAGSLGILGRGIGKMWNAMWTYPKTSLLIAAIVGGYIATAGTVGAGLTHFAGDAVSALKWILSTVAGFADKAAPAAGGLMP